MRGTPTKLLAIVLIVASVAVACLRGQVIELRARSDPAPSQGHSHRHGDHGGGAGHHHDHVDLETGTSHSHEDGAPHVHVGDEEAARVPTRPALDLPTCDFAVPAPPLAVQESDGPSGDPGIAILDREPPPDATLASIRSVRIQV